MAMVPLSEWRMPTLIVPPPVLAVGLAAAPALVVVALLTAVAADGVAPPAQAESAKVPASRRETPANHFLGVGIMDLFCLSSVVSRPERLWLGRGRVAFSPAQRRVSIRPDRKTIPWVKRCRLQHGVVFLPPQGKRIPVKTGGSYRGETERFQCNLCECPSPGARIGRRQEVGASGQDQPDSRL